MATQKTANRSMHITESGLLPDTIVRAGIRRLLRQRLDDIHAEDGEMSAAAVSGFIEMMDAAPIALLPEKANEQHYEIPAEFYQLALGEQRKYSCCQWSSTTRDLDQAEKNALRITCERAGIADGMRVLDLGCGWGSLSLWIASFYPGTSVTAVSNSNSQRDYIVAEARARGIGNLRVITCDMNDFAIDETFDRVVSVEMFEHMRNYRELFRRIAGWLEPGGRFFMHIFCHRNTPYEFIEKSEQDWMSRYFFSGGIMPSYDLPLFFQDNLRIQDRWRWSGTHYAKTANAWLRRMDHQRSRIMPVLESTYGKAAANTWWVRWRIFFMACAELFDYDNGEEWFVGHYLFEKPATP